MDAYNFVDIFATKGAEYLLVILFLMSLVPFWRFLHAPARPARLVAAAEPAFAPQNEWFQVPVGAFFHQGHTWALPEGNGVLRVGMDDFSQKLVGGCRQISLPALGTQVRQGGTAWQLHADSKSLAMLSPVNGEVIARNEEVVNAPGVVNEDPYGKGWLVKIKSDDVKADLTNLLSGRVAERWMEETVNSLRQRMAGNLGVVLQDGGLPMQGFARSIFPENWDKFAEEFLLSGVGSDREEAKT